MCLQPAQKKAGFTVLRAQFAQPAQKRPDLPCFERIVYTKPRQGRIYRALNTLCAASPEKIGFTVLRTHCLQPAQKRPDLPCFALIVRSQRRQGRIYRASCALCAASREKALQAWTQRARGLRHVLRVRGLGKVDISRFSIRFRSRYCDAPW